MSRPDPVRDGATDAGGCPDLHPSRTPVLVVGAGTMGAGIAQVAAQAGHRVHLHDARPGAAAQARAALVAGWERRVAAGKLDAATAQACAGRLQAVAAVAEAADARLAIEAVVERLEVKRALLRELEALLPADAVLASNTSSLSVTALAAELARPGRVVGMHFFNPVPAMKLVEIVSGLRSDPAVADAVYALAQAWGKQPVHASSTPGFIVNRIARPFYGEAWALLLERVAPPAVLDACLRGAGFRMGPCELMDLVGHDVNYAVTQSVYQAFHGDKRYQPSVLQQERVEAGLLGRKSGRGFYDVTAPPPPPSPWQAATELPARALEVRVQGRGAQADAWAQRLADAGLAPVREPEDTRLGLTIDGARLQQTDGRPAGQLGAETGETDLAVFDLDLGPAGEGAALAYAVSARALPAWAEQAPRWLHWLGYRPQRVLDAPGLVVARTVAMIVNEASDAVMQGVCSEAAADQAMRLGLNFPAGPFEWRDRWGAGAVVALIDRLDAHYRGERYRSSSALRRLAWQLG